MQSISSFLSEILTAHQDMTLWQTFLAILVAYLGGILASLTPCVYPMIPITVSVVGGIGHIKKSWKDTLFQEVSPTWAE